MINQEKFSRHFKMLPLFYYTINPCWKLLSYQSRYFASLSIIIQKNLLQIFLFVLRREAKKYAFNFFMNAFGRHLFFDRSCNTIELIMLKQMNRHRAKEADPPIFKRITLYERIHCRKCVWKKKKSRNVIFVTWIFLSASRERVIERLVSSTAIFARVTRPEKRAPRIRSRKDLFSGCRYVGSRLVKISHCAKLPSRLGKITRVRLRKRAMRV